MVKSQCRTLVLLLVFVCIFNTFVFKSSDDQVEEASNNDSFSELINITELSDEFVDDYFDGVKRLQESDNRDNVLIVISDDGIGDTYGATDVVAAPNHQYFLQYGSKEEKDQALALLQKGDGVLNVEENVKYTISEAQYNSWGINKMSLDAAIEVANENDLNEVVVAILDTGLDVDLANTYYDGKIKEVYNVLDGSTSINDMSDEVGHGTHVFGTIAEGTPNNVKILPIKVSDERSIELIDIINAVNYVAIYEKADIMNMSFGSSTYSAAQAEAIEAANQKNIISVAAAGNENSANSNFPASLASTISIASVDSELNKSYFSNYGTAIDFAAPGTDIVSLNGVKSGTSMATPHAVSAVAILKSYNKDLSLQNVKNLLMKHSLDLGVEGKDKYYGNGFITLYGASFCDGVSACDEFGVFSLNDANELRITGIAPHQSAHYPESNFGNITNLMNLSIDLNYGGLVIQKQLADLDGIVIENYDSSLICDYNTGSGYQLVDISYAGLSTQLSICNSYQGGIEGSGWSYEILDESSIKIVGLDDFIIELPRVVYIPDKIGEYNVVELGNNLFKNRVELRKVSLPATIRKIGDSVFENCSLISVVELPDVVQYIGDNAFKNTNLESVSFSNNLTYIGEGAFENTKIMSVSIPASVSSIGEGAFAGCNNIESIEVDPNNAVYDSRNNSNAIIETATNTLIKGFYDSEIPDDIEIIGAKAFYNDNRIESVLIPSSVETIAYYAFRYDSNVIESSLYLVFIPSSVTRIVNAFNPNNGNTVIYTFTDAYAKTYATNNRIPFRCIDASSINVGFEKYRYYAFERMSGNLTVSARYEIGEYNYGAYSTKTSTSRIFDGDVSEAPLYGIEIIYQDGRDSLRFGDSYVVVRGQTEYGEDYERNFPVSVLKATPEYTVPEGLSAKKGQTLSEIELPSGFSWMAPETELDELGETAFKVRFIPDDTNNYETVENIDVIITVLSATLVDIRTPNDVDVSVNGETLTLVSDKPTLIIGLINDGWVLVEVDSNTNNDGVMTNIYNIGSYDEVKVVLKGDGNMDGAVSTADSNLINKSLISSSLPPYRALTDIERLILDLDGDNAISTGDSNIINKSLISPSLPPYRAIRW